MILIRLWITAFFIIRVEMIDVCIRKDVVTDNHVMREFCLKSFYFTAFVLE